MDPFEITGRDADPFSLKQGRPGIVHSQAHHFRGKGAAPSTKNDRGPDTR